MRKFISEWQETVVVLILFILAYVSLKGIPHLDPRSGVDDLGFISGLIQSGAKVIFIFFFAWYYRRTYSHSTDVAREANVSVIQQTYPLAYYWTEKIHQLVVVAIVVYCFSA